MAHPPHRFESPASTQTLGEALAEYYATNPGLKRGAELGAAAREFFAAHDAVHVLYGCGTTLPDEAVVKLASIFGTTAGLSVLRGYLLHESLDIYRRLPLGATLLAVLAGPYLILRTVWRCARQRARWPWDGYRQHMSTPLGELRAQFGIRVAHEGRSASESSAEAIVDLYERHAAFFDRERGRQLQERAWLDRFLARVRPGGTVLDVGCGMGEPIARYVLEAGFHVVGVDASPSMIALCRERFPNQEWHVADMRALDLGRRFDGLIAWGSFIHLAMQAQRAMFPRLAAHALPGAPLLFTSGPWQGEIIGEMRGEPLYHASLDASEYRRLLDENGFAVLEHLAQDPDCGNQTVWLAERVAAR